MPRAPRLSEGLQAQTDDGQDHADRVVGQPLVRRNPGTAERGGTTQSSRYRHLLS